MLLLFVVCCLLLFVVGLLTFFLLSFFSFFFVVFVVVLSFLRMGDVMVDLDDPCECFPFPFLSLPYKMTDLFLVLEQFSLLPFRRSRVRINQSQRKNGFGKGKIGGTKKITEKLPF